MWNFILGLGIGCILGVSVIEFEIKPKERQSCLKTVRHISNTKDCTSCHSEEDLAYMGDKSLEGALSQDQLQIIWEERELRYDTIEAIKKELREIDKMGNPK